MRIFWFLLSIIFLGGCTVKTYTVEKSRVDTDIQGNRGYLSGAPEEESKESKFGKTRKVSIVEIEFGHGKIKESNFGKEKDIISEEMFLEDELFLAEEEEVISIREMIPEKKYEYYIIRKADTLQKISRKFYGTTKKWGKIYNANKNVLKGPDKIYPGMKIKIPVL